MGWGGQAAVITAPALVTGEGFTLVSASPWEVMLAIAGYSSCCHYILVLAY